ncbi:hypothetical protein LNTAR_16428 [Lentisphaera araneosa HTCC2155]|uniref:Uncharacterized protein n=1 Tax=Lentisphaera araneosa HTCC2155 TaxID=313628 RepID=A6DQA0_9BACT|nr:hypothetical protein [Lentisphaera araneosa]EDM26151.1 hypothetical protein LNTAR_16428 [Lentisphaera araneosa HTCC2155]
MIRSDKGEISLVSSPSPHHPWQNAIIARGGFKQDKAAIKQKIKIGKVNQAAMSSISDKNRFRKLFPRAEPHPFYYRIGPFRIIRKNYDAQAPDRWGNSINCQLLPGTVIVETPYGLEALVTPPCISPLIFLFMLEYEIVSPVDAINSMAKDLGFSDDLKSVLRLPQNSWFRSVQPKHHQIGVALNIESNPITTGVVL